MFGVVQRQCFPKIAILFRGKNRASLFVTMFPIVEVLLGMVEIVKENTSTQQRELVEQIFSFLSFSLSLSHSL